MKRIILVFLVFITTILKGQSVDPETFPTLNTGIGNKYLYTNTGGEGKMLVDSVATRTRIYCRNGVNGQDSLGLGGNLVQPTTINVDGNSFLLSSSPLSTMGYFPYSSLKDQWAMIANPQGSNVIAVNNCLNDTAIGNEYISNAMIIVDISNGKEKGFDNKYNYGTTGVVESLWKYVNPTTSEELYLGLDDVTGFTVTPNGTVGPYMGTSIFLVKNTSGVDVYKIAPSGRITETIPAYADDSAAGLAGLTAGDVYQTDGTGAAPLNVAGIRMIKQ